MYRPRFVTLGFATLALTVVVTGCSAGPDRDDSGVITESGELDAFSIKVGDCLNNPTASGEEFESVAAVPCAEPHDLEAYALFDLPDGDLPAEPSLGDQAAEGCLDAFRKYVGVDYQDSIYEVLWFNPTPESWEQGDQEIVCLAADANGAKLSTGVKGSGL